MLLLRSCDFSGLYDAMMKLYVASSTFCVEWQARKLHFFLLVVTFISHQTPTKFSPLLICTKSVSWEMAFHRPRQWIMNSFSRFLPRRPWLYKQKGRVVQPSFLLPFLVYFSITLHGPADIPDRSFGSGIEGPEFPWPSLIWKSSIARQDSFTQNLPDYRILLRQEDFPRVRKIPDPKNRAAMSDGLSAFVYCWSWRLLSLLYSAT